MPLADDSIRRSADEQAFAHYLRTGERLTRSEWLARHEVKFNPWHDRIGRFTFGPGGAGQPAGSRTTPARKPAAPRPVPRATATGRAAKPPRPAPGAGSGFRSELVRNALEPGTSTADTYFELNKRQAALDRLRIQAGPHPHPKVAGDLAELQARLDHNRRVLDARYRVADQQTTELLRSGLAPFDVAAGAAAIATGKGELGDYLAVAGVIPGGGAAGKIAKVARVARVTERVSGPLGGAYRMVRKLQPKGNHAHHLIPQRFRLLPKWDSPTISMLREDHKLTISWASKSRRRRYQALVNGRIRTQGIIATMEMDARFIRRKLGTKYDEAIQQAIEYGRSIGYKAWIIRLFR